MDSNIIKYIVIGFIIFDFIFIVILALYLLRKKIKRLFLRLLRVSDYLEVRILNENGQIIEHPTQIAVDLSLIHI